MRSLTLVGGKIGVFHDALSVVSVFSGIRVFLYLENFYCLLFFGIEVMRVVPNLKQNEFID